MRSRSDLPRLDGASLIRLHNAGPWAAPLVVRVLAAALPVEVSRERDRLIRAAGRAVKLRKPTTIALVEALRRRMARLAELGPPSYIDPGGLPDGALQAALLLGGNRVPSTSTVQRALWDLDGTDELSEVTPPGEVTREPARPLVVSGHGDLDS